MRTTVCRTVEIHFKQKESRNFEIYDSYGHLYTNIIYANSETGEVVQALLDDRGYVKVDNARNVLFIRWKPPGGICISPKKVK